MSRIGGQVLALAEDYAATIKALGNRAAANTTQALNSSLNGILDDLQRFYNSFTDEAIPSDLNAQGQERRPAEYSIAQATARYGELVQIAAGFMSGPQLAALDTRYQADLQEAVKAGGELSQKLLQLVEPGRQTSFAAPDPAVFKAAAEGAGAYIRGEAMRFRNDLVQIVMDGIGQGKGYKGVLPKIRQLLQGAADPGGVTRRLGLEQRAELIARSELANAFVQAQLDLARREGYTYMRWIATFDERTCPVCGSRHGRVFKLNELVAPAHPLCRCVLSPVPAAAVDGSVGEQREQLLEAAFWKQQQQDMVRELAASLNGDLASVERKLSDALSKPTPSERRRYPDISTSAQPVA